MNKLNILSYLQHVLSLILNTLEQNYCKVNKHMQVCKIHVQCISQPLWISRLPMDTHFILPLICISIEMESIKNECSINTLLISEICKRYRFLPITNMKYITIAYVPAMGNKLINIMIAHIAIRQYLTITNWRLLQSLHMKPPRILGGYSKKQRNSINSHKNQKYPAHQSNNSNYPPLSL